MSDYQKFIESKAPRDVPTGFSLEEEEINSNLFPFQRAIVRWAIHRGRAALFVDTGLGKGPMQCEWARLVSEYTGKPVLILAPLAVAAQMVGEAKKVLGLDIKRVAAHSDVCGPGVYVTNYQKLHHFDASEFGGVSCDESSLIKDSDSKTRTLLIETFADTPFRLCNTASPSPNDYAELGNHAQFLGVMSMQEMLAMFFINDSGNTQTWRLKGHAEKEFWAWLSSWAVCVKNPSDLGFDGSGYILPPLHFHEHIIASESTAEGELFPTLALTLNDQRKARKDSIEDRVNKAVEIIGDSQDQWLIWCGLHNESEALKNAISGAVEVKGADTDEHKEKSAIGFASGEIKRLVSKGAIFGSGMNWQSCHNMIFVGIGHSFETLYQSVRRCWRFGQKHPVHVHIVLSEREGAVLANVKRKESDMVKMQQALVEHMKDFTKKELLGFTRITHVYSPKKPMTIPSWLTKATCCVTSYE